MENIREITLAYLAGILDGEGWITKRCRGNKWSAYIGLEMTDQNIPALFKSTFGGTFTFRDRSGKPGRQNEKPTFIWGVGGERAREVYEMLEPYLRLKKFPVLSP